MPTSNPWRLYGTLGCHLCEQAEQLLQQFAETRALTWQHIDIAELPTEQMLELAHQIPIICRADTCLTWPFSLVDLVQLYHD
ncbi:MAG: glutaredoxin family protein [Pseudomonadota bacterium]|nr:glutaredoxin family protein [Pseudomonadota bacterium]